MSLCPFAVKKLIPPGANDPRIKARLGIWHVDAGNAESLFSFFRDRSGGIESHFFIKKDGVLEQYRDTDWQADANFRANDFAVSVETQGFGPGEWTDEQLDTSKRLMRWLNAVEGIPLEKAKSWDGAGFGYHTMWGAPSNWTPVAKTCPGRDRIEQFNQVLVPWLNRGAPMPVADPTPNITNALMAKTLEERRKALRKVVRNGSDEASAAAKAWLQALNAIEDARAAAKVARVDLSDLKLNVGR